MKGGIAVDIDDTLANTNRYWFEYFISHFGNSEGLSLHEMIKKYRYVQFVEQWQTPAILKVMEEFRDSNERQEAIMPIEGSIEAINKINESLSISYYLTTRPLTVFDGTKNWLKKYGFPEAEIIMKPVEIDLDNRDAWKSKKFSELYPEVSGIIDDSTHFIKLITSDYKGVVFHYDCEEKVRDDINVIPCKTWKIVVDEVEKYYRKLKVTS